MKSMLQIDVNIDTLSLNVNIVNHEYFVKKTFDTRHPFI